MSLPSIRDFLDALVQVRDVDSQYALVAQAGFHTSSELPQLIEELSTRVRECLTRDTALASVLAETSVRLAEGLNSPRSLAFATQSRAHVLMGVRQNREAVPIYERAVSLFAEAGDPREQGRTLSAAAENLTVLGEYERARERAEKARGLLEASGDMKYLARVHVALGNLFNRLNRTGESLEEYDRAHRVAETIGDHIVVAAVEINRAEALTDFNRLDEAIASLEAARAYCGRHGIVLWDEVVDRNLADLHFKRGSYSEALRSLEKVRPRYAERGDDQRLALCDMGRAEIYLQLNQPSEAAALAASAARVFEERSSLSELAESASLVGIADAELGDVAAAQKSFSRAGELYRSLGNVVAAAGVDLQLSKLKQKAGDLPAAEQLATSSATTFESEGLGVRGAYARIVLAHVLHDGGRADEAVGQAERALAGLAGYHARWVSYQCHDLLATLYLEQGDADRAESLYRKAIEEMESLRGNIRLDEFRMSFGRDKYQVYDNLIHLKLTSGAEEQAFELVERSKSRTLIDLLEKSSDSIWGTTDDAASASELRKLRQDLNGLYSQLSQVGTTLSVLSTDTSLQEEISRTEEELLGRLRAAGSGQGEWEAIESPSLPDLAAIQAMLEADEILIEYYAVHGQFCAFVVGPDTFTVVPDLASATAVQDALKGLTFQLAKFQLGAAYTATHAERLLVATRYHLQALDGMLVAPLADRIEGRSLVVVPHGVLHYLPFHALFDGEAFLVDRHEVVYGASASMVRLCRARATEAARNSVVLAVPDEGTPSILEEARMLGELLPDARVFVGSEATARVLAENGRHARWIHIAAHGVFRSDNPMFSSLRLGDSWLNLVDIFNLRLGADLTTLSACETGMSALLEGDELLGLARGFLYAGTPSLVVSLWRVNDRSTTLLMQTFYEELLGGASKPRALRRAILRVKQEYPHPYYWAPFVLIGKS